MAKRIGKPVAPMINLPFTRDLVLVGGGHSHALFLRKWAMAPLAGVRVTVINPGPTAPYSGMLPGFVAGHYSRSELDIDLVRLARAAGARLVLGFAQSIDPVARRVTVPGRPDIAYDLASIDVGITSDLPALPGFKDHAVPAKPLGRFATEWDRFRDGTGPAEVVIIGAGIAGAELAMAMAHALNAADRPCRITLIDRSNALAGVRPDTSRKLHRALRALNIELIENSVVTEVMKTGVRLESGQQIQADFVVGAASARPQAWLAGSGLDHTDGFLNISETLQTSDPDVFAVGDCAHFVSSPRPKAGVFAVRQAPVLYENLRRRLAGQDRLLRYRPQRDYLKLVSLGGKSALADRFAVSPSGPFVWRWKDRIDRKFMRRFSEMTPMASPSLPRDHAEGLIEALGDKPLCGGCGAKVGPSTLTQALSGLAAPARVDAERPDGDDAGLLTMNGVRQVLSTDHLRAFVEDPVTMTRIAAVHALGDIWSMGASPQSALVQVILPRMSPELAGRTLREITHTAQEVFAAEGAAILGGHSSQGAEMTLGFTVTGLCNGPALTLAGAQPGDLLVMTKPVGTGVIMAAEMAMAAPGASVAAAIESMCRAQGAEAATLVAAGARAMTDVTGFGLYGHIANICLASGCGAEIDAASVPVLPGALDLAAEGHRSSLFPENRALWHGEGSVPNIDILFDPQTSGGLLAAIPDTAKARDILRNSGITAHVIGRVTGQNGQVDIL